MASVNWDLWPKVAKKLGKDERKKLRDQWAEPGVYALVATKKCYTTMLGGESRVLYIGEAGNLFTRLRHRREDDRPNHHFLWYWIEAKNNLHLPAELKEVLKQLNSDFQPRIHGWKLDNESEERNDWNNGKHKAPRKLLEELLLIKHFFKYGQFPPLNAKVPSVKSIATYWHTWWGKCEEEPDNWRLPDVKKCWEELLKKK